MEMRGEARGEHNIFFPAFLFLFYFCNQFPVKRLRARRGTGDEGTGGALHGPSSWPCHRPGPWPPWRPSIRGLSAAVGGKENEGRQCRKNVTPVTHHVKSPKLSLGKSATRPRRWWNEGIRQREQDAWQGH
jgi:hypothetical protein